MNEREEAEKARGADSRDRGNSGNATPPASRPAERGRKAKGDAQSLLDDVEGWMSEADGFVRSHLADRPYTTLAMAVGAGFVVGGGLTVGVLGSLVRIGARLATAAAMNGALARLVSENQEGESA